MTKQNNDIEFLNIALNLNHGANKKGVMGILTEDQVKTYFIQHKNCVRCGAYLKVNQINLVPIRPFKCGGHSVIDNMQGLCNECSNSYKNGGEVIDYHEILQQKDSLVDWAFKVDEVKSISKDILNAEKRYKRNTRGVNYYE